MSERFMVDDAGTLIDMVSRDTFDYVGDVVGLLNDYAEENESLKFQLKECQEHKLYSRRELERENKELKQRIKEAEGMEFQILHRDIELLKRENSELKQQNRQLTLIGEQQADFIQSKGYDIKELIDFVRNGEND